MQTETEVLKQEGNMIKARLILSNLNRGQVAMVKGTEKELQSTETKIRTVAASKSVLLRGKQLQTRRVNGSLYLWVSDPLRVTFADKRVTQRSAA